MVHLLHLSLSVSGEYKCTSPQSSYWHFHTLDACWQLCLDIHEFIILQLASIISQSVRTMLLFLYRHK